MAQGQTKGKYWLANNPNAGITNAEVTALGEQTATELDLLDGAVAGTVAASKAVIYSSAAAIVGHPIAGGSYIPVLGAATAMPASTSLLVKNTYYEEALTDAETFLLPTVANSTAGDWIIFRQPSAITNDEKITIGSAANGDFAIGCQLRGVSVTSTASTESTDLSVSGDNSVIIEGDTNGCGSGVINFVFNGTAWTVSSMIRNGGNGSAAVVGSAGCRFAATA